MEKKINLTNNSKEEIEMKDFSVKITKKQLALKVNNSMVHNFYYVIYGRIYNVDKTRMRKFKFVIWFDIFDVQEWCEKEYCTKYDINELADEIGWNTLEGQQNLIKSYDDCTDFYDWCNETIKNYNRIR